MHKILVVIPAYNEENNILYVIDSLKKEQLNIDYLIIDDCSSDSTKQVCKTNDLEYISFSVNLGIGGGVQAGYKYAVENDYDIVIQCDGDGQHDMKYLSDLISPIIDGAADIVIGSRFIEKKGFQSSSTRRIGINTLSKLIFLCCGVSVKDVTSGYRAVNRKFISIYAKDYAQDYPEPEAIVTAAMHHGIIKETPVMMRERYSGKSSISPIKSVYYMLKVSIAIILSRLTYSRLEVNHNEL